MSIEAMKQALEALEISASCVDPYYVPLGKSMIPEVEAAIDVLSQAIEQAEKQEPVAWVHLHEWKSGEFWPDDCFAPIDCTGMTPLYTAPPQREWVGLTDEEMQSMWLTASTATPKNPSWSRHIRFWKAIEAKLREKNHG